MLSSLGQVGFARIAFQHAPAFGLRFSARRVRRLVSTSARFWQVARCARGTRLGDGVGSDATGGDEYQPEHRPAQKECGPQELVFAGEDAFGDYRGDASCVEQTDEEKRYAWRRYRRERERRGALRTLYQDRDQKAVAGVERVG